MIKFLILAFFFLISNQSFGQREDCKKIEKAFNLNNIEGVSEYVPTHGVIFSSSVPATDLEENPISKLEFKKKLLQLFKQNSIKECKILHVCEYYKTGVECLTPANIWRLETKNGKFFYFFSSMDIYGNVYMFTSFLIREKLPDKFKHLDK